MDNVDINVVYAICSAGIKIAKIQDRYYKIDFWQEATQTMLKHHLKGRDVTEKLISSPQIANKGREDQQLSSLVMSFSDIIPRSIDFSNSIQFIIYT